MELYLIRHGIAAERTEYLNDEMRPLTPKGEEKTQSIAKRIQEIGIKFDLILSSPLIRARQTADILKNAGLSQKLEAFIPLSPEGNIQDWVNWWLENRYNNAIRHLALVGHQPNLGNWAEMLVWGTIKNKIIVKKAGIIGLSIPDQEMPIGNSELFLLTSPKWLLK
jgi:phosphohistidine phosphatase